MKKLERREGEEKQKNQFSSSRAVIITAKYHIRVKHAKEKGRRPLYGAVKAISLMQTTC